MEINFSLNRHLIFNTLSSIYCGNFNFLFHAVDPFSLELSSECIQISYVTTHCTRFMAIIVTFTELKCIPMHQRYCSRYMSMHSPTGARRINSKFKWVWVMSYVACRLRHWPLHFLINCLHLSAKLHANQRTIEMQVACKKISENKNIKNPLIWSITLVAGVVAHITSM